MSTDIASRVSGYKQDADRALQVDGADDNRVENPNPLFRAGQSNRVWGELYKVALFYTRNALGSRFIGRGC